MSGGALSLPERFNVSEYFIDRNLGEGGGHRVAILFGDQQLTYRQVAEQVGRAANALRAQGVQAGDRVLLLLYDSPQFVAAFWGAIRMGAIPVPTNTLLSAEDYAFMLRDSRASGLVTEEDLLEKIAPALTDLPCLKSVLVSESEHPTERRDLPIGEIFGKRACVSFDDSLAASRPECAAAPTLRDDPAFWLYTSGSTGKPKAAIHRHRGMVCCLENFARQVLGIRPDDVMFSTSKLFFAYGLGNGLYFPFGVGASTVLVRERPTAEKVLEVLSRYRPTMFFAVPAVYAALLHASGGGAASFSSVRCAVSAGESLPAPLWGRFKEKFGAAILDGIGSTEMLHMFISNRPDDVVPGSSGKLVPGYAARIVDEHGNLLPSGEIGELQIRGESAAAGYWNRPELTAQTFRGDWTVTGDKYSRDERGYFRYCGRTDDMMKVSGLWVSPLEVESVLLTHPGVLECAVVGVTDHDGLTRPKAFVVLKDAGGAEDSTEELLNFLKGRLPSYKVPRWISQMESLPRTATGKIQRFKLRTLQHDE